MIVNRDEALLLVAAAGLAAYGVYELVGWVRWRVAVRRKERVRRRGFEMVTQNARR